jgi:hypothetical protein
VRVLALSTYATLEAAVLIIYPSPSWKRENLLTAAPPHIGYMSIILSIWAQYIPQMGYLWNLLDGLLRTLAF